MVNSVSPKPGGSFAAGFELNWAAMPPGSTRMRDATNRPKTGPAMIAVGNPTRSE